MNIKHTIFVMVALAGTTFGMPAANAAEFNGQFRAGLGVSDNIARVTDDEQDETMLTLGFNFGVTEQTRRLDLNLRSQIDFIDYLDETFNSQIVGGMNLLANLTLVDQRVIWVVQDTYGQQLANPLQPARPNNRADVNFLTTGPSIRFLPSGRNQLNLDLRYSDVTFEDLPSDNDRISATLSYGRDVSRNTNLSYNVSAEEIEFDESGPTSDFDRKQAFVRYARTGNQNTIGFNVGYNVVEVAGNENDGLLLQFDFRKQISANGLFTVTGGSRFSDQGNIFRFSNTNAPDLRDPADNLNTTDPFLNNFFTAGWNLQQERYSFAISGNWSQQDFKGAQISDRDVYGGDIALRRDLTRKLLLSGRVRFQKRDFKYLGRVDENTLIGVNLGYRFTPGLLVSLDYLHSRRDSSVANSEFDENRLFVQFAYTPVWSR